MIGEIRRSNTVLRGVTPEGEHPILPNGKRARLWQAQVIDGPYATRTTALEVAQLFEAAPDLLAAARKALEIAEDLIRSEYEGSSRFAPMMADLQPVRDAIAKAEGRS